MSGQLLQQTDYEQSVEQIASYTDDTVHLQKDISHILKKLFAEEEEHSRHLQKVLQAAVDTLQARHYESESPAQGWIHLFCHLLSTQTMHAEAMAYLNQQLSETAARQSASELDNTRRSLRQETEKKAKDFKATDQTERKQQSKYFEACAAWDNLTRESLTAISTNALKQRAEREAQAQKRMEQTKQENMQAIEAFNYARDRFFVDDLPELYKKFVKTNAIAGEYLDSLLSMYLSQRQMCSDTNLKLYEHSKEMMEPFKFQDISTRNATLLSNFEQCIPPRKEFIPYNASLNEVLNNDSEPSHLKKLGKSAAQLSGSLGSLFGSLTSPSNSITRHGSHADNLNQSGSQEKVEQKLKSLFSGSANKLSDERKSSENLGQNTEANEGKSTKLEKWMKMPETVRKKVVVNTKRAIQGVMVSMGATSPSQEVDNDASPLDTSTTSANQETSIPNINRIYVLRALHDFQASDHEEMSFKKEDILHAQMTEQERQKDVWWWAETPDRLSGGFVPAEYFQITEQRSFTDASFQQLQLKHIDVPHSPTIETTPYLIKFCIAHVEAQGLDVEGIYRLSGSHRRIKAIKEHYDKTGEILMDEDTCIHDLTGLLKLYLREATDPPVPKTEDVQKHLNAILECSLLTEQCEHWEALFRQLPRRHCRTLEMLACNLSKVVQHANENKMTLNNVARVFAPTLFPNEEDLNRAARLVESLIECAGPLWQNINILPSPILAPSITEDFDELDPLQLINSLLEGTSLK